MYWLYYQVQNTVEWLLINKRFDSYKEGKEFIDKIERGETEFIAGMRYRIIRQ